MMDLFGKHRPDFLARCTPDLIQLGKYAVGGSGDQIPEGVLLVSWEICKSQQDGSGVGVSDLDDGFRSFPSGHCMSKSKR